MDPIEIPGEKTPEIFGSERAVSESDACRTVNFEENSVIVNRSKLVCRRYGE